MIEELSRRAESLLWPSASDPPRAAATVALVPVRCLYALVRDLLEGQLTLRAMSLVYTTLLSVVPLLAFSFAILKGFEVHHELEPMLKGLFEPLGEQGAKISDEIMGFVDNVNGRLLGGVGLALLLFSVLSMVQKVEGSFNYIWRVSEVRGFARRFSDYLSVLLIAPLLTVAAMGLIATVSSNVIVQALRSSLPFGDELELAGHLGSFLLLTVVFAFAFSFITNTRVRLSAALIGGVCAAVLWVVAGKLFATFVAGSANYAAIYAGFAVAIIALIWLQVAWLILLLGAQIAFYCQYPEYMKSGRKRLGISARRRETLALAVIATVGRAFRDGQPRLREDQLAEALQVPGEALSGVTRDLERSGLLVRSSEGAMLPGRELGCVTLYEIIQAVRKAGDDSSRQESLESHPPVEVVVDNVDLAVARSLEGRTAQELVDAAPNLGTDPDSGGESRAVN